MQFHTPSKQQAGETTVETINKTRTTFTLNPKVQPKWMSPRNGQNCERCGFVRRRIIRIRTMWPMGKRRARRLLRRKRGRGSTIVCKISLICWRNISRESVLVRTLEPSAGAASKGKRNSSPTTTARNSHLTNRIILTSRMRAKQAETEANRPTAKTNNS